MGVGVFLVVIALILTIVSFFNARYPLLAVAVLLLCIAGLVSTAGSIHLGAVTP